MDELEVCVQSQPRQLNLLWLHLLLVKLILQRSNYSEPSTLLGQADEDEEVGGGRATKGRARQPISDKRAAEEGRKKKSTMNIRTAVLYKKNFALLVEESVSVGVSVAVQSDWQLNMDSGERSPTVLRTAPV